MALSLACTSIALLLAPPTPLPAVAVNYAPVAVSFAQPTAAQSLLFPTSQALAGTVTSFDDELEKIAAKQKAEDAKIDARKAEIRARQEAQEAKEAAEFEAKEKLAAERKAKSDAAAAALKAKNDAKKAALAEASAAKVAPAAAATDTSSKKSSKYQQVEKVSSRSERIAARKAAGEEAPSFFGN